jgi:flavin reductase (DIM6/NTAB) family NADH-FMN oxidoreductase RutF
MMKSVEKFSVTLDTESLRHAMRAWTTGVGVLMSAHAGEVYGVTINSFASLSLDPPLVTVVLKNDSLIYHMVTGSRAFSVTLLAADQQAVAENFAGKLRGAERMGSIPMQTLPSGMPVLQGGLAWLDCRVVHTHAAGVNTLFIAEVAEANVHSTKNPLVYHDRGYHSAKAMNLMAGGNDDRPTDS